MHRKKKMMLPVHWGRGILIATDANLLDTTYEFCGFNDDLRDPNN